MDKKNNTKEFLAESLRLLIQRMPFHSITIKKICDEAGVVRVTFYNYFVDKYDALDYLVQTDLEAGIFERESDPLMLLLTHLAKVLSEHRRFYEISVEIDGQNGFQEIYIQRLGEGIKRILDVHRTSMAEAPELDNAFLAQTHAVLIFYLVRTWLKNPSLKEEDFIKYALKMSQSSFYDFMK